MNAKIFAVLALSFLWTTPALADAHGHKKPGHAVPKETNKTMEGVVALKAWARASTPNAKNGAAYVTIMNHGMKADRLVGASSGVAAKVELHTHKNDAGVMRMRRISSVEVPAHGTAHLKPGGDHIMLMGLKTPLKAGERIALTLILESGQEIQLEAMVMKKAPAKKMKHNH